MADCKISLGPLPAMCICDLSVEVLDSVGFKNHLIVIKRFFLGVAMSKEKAAKANCSPSIHH